MSREENLRTLQAWKRDERPVVAKYDEFVPGCTGKRRHPNKDAALFAIRLRRDRMMSAYHCSNCNGWHTGHPRPSP